MNRENVNKGMKRINEKITKQKRRELFLLLGLVLGVFAFSVRLNSGEKTQQKGSKINK